MNIANIAALPNAGRTSAGPNVAAAGSSSPSTAAAAESAAQEALETATVTKAEAAKGDQQAIRKLARAKAAQPAQTLQPRSVNTTGPKPILNVTA